MDLLQQLFASLELLLVTMAVFDIEFRAASMVFTRSATATLKRRWQNLELFCTFNGEHLEVRISHAGSLTGEHLHVMPSHDVHYVLELLLKLFYLNLEPCHLCLEHCDPKGRLLIRSQVWQLRWANGS